MTEDCTILANAVWIHVATTRDGNQLYRNEQSGAVVEIRVTATGRMLLRERLSN